MAAASTEERSYSVPGYPAPIHLRESVSDHAIFWQCIVERQYDMHRFPHGARLMEAYRAALAAGRQPLIIDCGGNVGLSALYLASMFPEARVAVVEPDEANFALLERNTAALGERVLTLKGGIWHEKGHLRIVNPDSGSSTFQVETVQDAAAGTIRAYTIAEICAIAGADAPLIVKVDIEGAQAKLFSANTAWVGDTHLLMLELDDWLMPWQGTSRSFFSCASRYPFEYLIHGETIFCFRDFGPPAGR